LTAEQIHYMVLSDVNYFFDIFSGQCVSIFFKEKLYNSFFDYIYQEHSWRHDEFKKFSNKSSKILYSNAAICSYSDDQYMSATKALQQIFSRKNNNVNTSNISKTDKILSTSCIVR
jgi:hypothetical protein